ncbi:MAG: sensor histidine kinase, partial [Lachnospiraceae bacterium]|nr:sensor histidine kinase [Lachnospiraceae bacterium]
MTKRLKKRFVMFTMTAVTCLLLFIVIAINALNWVMMERQSDTLLDVLVDMDSSFHKPETNRPFPFARPMNADRMRSSHFFVVRIDSSGNILDVNTDQITSLDTADAEDLASKAIAAGKTSGKVEEFKYAVKQIGTDRLLFFIDTSAQSDSFYRVLLASGAIAVLCWVLLLIIVLLLSGKVLRPVLNGMEKQKQFITNAGHEMKTPLAIIRSNNDTMALIHGENKYNTHIRA